MLILRFGDQMNNVAVTDGDKVDAEMRLGYHVDYCPVSELMEYGDTHTLGVVVSGLHHSLNLFRRVGCTFIYYFYRKISRIIKSVNHLFGWDTMDMDFMNLNQSAHGDREFGHICARMNVKRKVVVGYWKDKAVQEKIAVWSRVAAAWADSQDMLILRFGDQMNNVHGIAAIKELCACHPPKFKIFKCFHNV